MVERFIVFKYLFLSVKFKNKKCGICVVIIVWLFVVSIVIVFLFYYLDFYSRFIVCILLFLMIDMFFGWEYFIFVFIVFNFLVFIVVVFG